MMKNSYLPPYPTLGFASGSVSECCKKNTAFPSRQPKPLPCACFTSITCRMPQAILAIAFTASPMLSISALLSTMLLLIFIGCALAFNVMVIWVLWCHTIQCLESTRRFKIYLKQRTTRMHTKVLLRSHKHFPVLTK